MNFKFCCGWSYLTSTEVKIWASWSYMLSCFFEVLFVEVFGNDELCLISLVLVFIVCWCNLVWQLVTDYCAIYLFFLLTQASDLNSSSVFSDVFLWFWAIVCAFICCYSNGNLISLVIEPLLLFSIFPNIYYAKVHLLNSFARSSFLQAAIV